MQIETHVVMAHPLLFELPLGLMISGVNTLLKLLQFFFSSESIGGGLAAFRTLVEVTGICC